jgi:hypothetical protein
MPRPCQRARLESGLKLDLNWLIRQRVIVRGCTFRHPRGISWTNSYTGEQIASAEIMFNLEGAEQGWLYIKIGQLDQRIMLVADPRHFGGRQWYFLCPFMNRRASVLWMPPGVRRFACRQAWARQVAYSSQFVGRDDRAHRGKAKINSRLCSLGGFDPDEWEFPPKPKWMRWRTYNLAENKFDRYESILDEGVVELAARLGMRFRRK